MLEQLLENSGHIAALADSGQAGIEMFRNARQLGEPFDVVITDLGMPYLDGRQVAQTIKRESPDMPVVMLTGWGTMMKDDGDTPTQVDAVLSKPPKINELFETVARVLEIRRNQRPPLDKAA
jgi:CheY-like chemotaxis protein